MFKKITKNSFPTLLMLLIILNFLYFFYNLEITRRITATIGKEQSKLSNVSYYLESFLNKSHLDHNSKEEAVEAAFLIASDIISTSEFTIIEECNKNIVLKLLYNKQIPYLLTILDRYQTLISNQTHETISQPYKRLIDKFVKHTPAHACSTFSRNINDLITYKAFFSSGFNNDLNKVLRNLLIDLDRLSAHTSKNTQITIIILLFIFFARERYLKYKLKNLKNKLISHAKTQGEIIEKATKKWQELAQFDPLTKLPNRRSFLDLTQISIAESNRYKKKLCLLFIDLDYFKNINDIHGHTFGDKFLIEVAKRISSVLRENDKLCRLGGDEFTLTATVNNSVDSGIVADKVIKALKKPFTFNNIEICGLSASIGVAICPDDAKDREDLLRLADAAMYQAKENGRGVYKLYNEQIQDKATRKNLIRNKLMEAIQKKQLSLYYQPKISKENGCYRIAGLEALLRWEERELEPKWGFVSPAEFIPIAEESRLIHTLGAWVLHEACSQAKAWINKDITKFRIAVNVSPRQLENKKIITNISSALKNAGIAPKHLEIEITESSNQNWNNKEVMQILKKIKRLGVAISIDDVGTHDSNLQRIRDWWREKVLDCVKIDQTFIRELPDDIASDKANYALVVALLTMCRSLGLKTVAEGVEKKIIKEWLFKINCNEIQGYYFSKPLTAAIVEEKLKNQDWLLNK